MKPFLLVSVLFAVAAAAQLRAQEIDATVTVNADQLPFTLQQEVAGFADDMQHYVNQTRWTAGEWEGGKIKMNFSVVFTGYVDGVYGAKLVVGSQRAINNSEKFSPMVKILDEAWNFQYVRSQPFIQDPTRYDPLTGLIDFYVNIAIGLDLDSYGSLGGASSYEKSWTLAQRAQVRNDVNGWSPDVASGNYSRYGLIRELTELRFAPIRRFIYSYHYNGLDLIQADRKAALDSINNHLTALVIVKDKLVQPSVLLRVFNDAKYIEYAELFAGYPDATVWRKLLYLDPGHQSVYEEAKSR